MEIKKNPEADLRKKSGLFLNIGLVVSLLFVVVAFEWRSYDATIAGFGEIPDEFEEVIEIPPTEITPPPPPQLQQPEIIEVEDEEEIEKPDIKMDVEVTEDTKVEKVIIEDEEEEAIEAPVIAVEVSAEPPGGIDAFRVEVMKYATKNYPEKERRLGIGGVVVVQFVVEKDGTLTDIKVAKGVSTGLDALALESIKSQVNAKWKPAIQGGRKVRQLFTLPLNFRIS